MSALGCAICGDTLPPPKHRRPRVICDRRECLLEVRRFGARKRAAMRRREPKPTPPSEYHCPRCDTTKPYDEAHFYVDRRDHETGAVLALSRWCRDCKRFYQRSKAQRKKDNARARRKRAHLRALPPDHEAVEHRRKLDRERAARWRRRYPEKVRAAQRRYYARVKRDRARLQAKRERDRMNYRLRRERGGVAALGTGRRRPEKARDERALPTAPAAPLAHKIDALIGVEEVRLGTNGATEDAVCERLGIAPRQLYAWREGEILRVSFDVADRVLTRADLLPLDVWDEDVVERLTASA